jgi:hypothetical protein
VTLRGKYSPDSPVAYGAPVRCPRYVPGEIITSVVHGTNANLLREAAKLWICPEDRLIDVTAGKGTFWRDTDVRPVRSDIRLLPGIDLIADCRKLPYPDASMDVVVFDPPYQPVHGQPERSFGVARSYGLTGGPVVLQAISDVLGLYEAGIAECARVLVPGTGRLLVKCPDMTDNHRLHLVSLDVLRLMTAAGVDLADHFILVNKSRMPQRTQRQQRAHRAHSYLWVGVKEPGTPSGEQRRAVQRARELAQAAATVQTLAACLGDSTQDPGQFYAAYGEAREKLRDLLASLDEAAAGSAGPGGDPPHAYIPAGPVETAPYLGYCPPEVRLEAFGAVLEGVETGAYDAQIVNWLAGWDDPTCRAIASLMWRCHLAGRAGPKKKAEMTEITPRPGQEPELRPGPWAAGPR